MRTYTYSCRVCRCFAITAPPSKTPGKLKNRVAIYHFTAKVIKRSHGRSAVAAAYRSASVFTDQRQGQSFDYSEKSGVIHSEIILPVGAPEWMKDRETL